VPFDHVRLAGIQRLLETVTNDSVALSAMDDADRTALAAGDDPLYDFWCEYVGRSPVAFDMIASVARGVAITRWGFANLGPDALDHLTACAIEGGVVEVGAGTGYLSALLAGRGVDVVAADLGRELSSEIANAYHSRTGAFFDVLHGGPEFAARFPRRTLLLAWPPEQDPMAVRALHEFTVAGGTQLAYVGERDGGCTADDAFHATLSTQWVETSRVPTARWPGAGDDLIMYRRTLGS
jgi:hypothetical protein